MKYTPSQDAINRFWALVSPLDANGCRDWRGPATRGYGRFWSGRQIWQAHRFAFGLAHGFAALEPRAHICHACDRPICVEPTHLWQGTPGENAADSTAKGRRASGEAYPNAKLTADAVREIRGSGATVKDAVLIGGFMAKFGVSYTTICHVITRQAWKHVK